MIMQSNSDTIRVLPALPSAWKAGHMTGMKAVKDFTVSTYWKNGKATRVVIVNNQGQAIPVLYKDLASATVYVNGKKADFEVDANGVGVLSGEAGTEYVFDFDGTYSGIESASKDASAPALSVDGRKVSFSGNVKQVRVFDLAGRSIQRSRKASFTVDSAAGHAVLLEVTDAEGNVSTHKVALQ